MILTKKQKYKVIQGSNSIISIETKKTGKKFPKNGTKDMRIYIEANIDRHKKYIRDKFIDQIQRHEHFFGEIECNKVEIAKKVLNI